MKTYKGTFGNPFKFDYHEKEIPYQYEEKPLVTVAGIVFFAALIGLALIGCLAL